MSMKQMMEQLKTEKGLGEYQNIAHGHEAVKVNWKKTILMNLVGMHGSSVRVGKYFLFYFTPMGMGLVEYHSKTMEGIDTMLPWKEITEFQVEKGFLENDLKFTYQGQKFHMKLSRVMLTDPWVKENMKNLMANQFYRISM